MKTSTKRSIASLKRVYNKKQRNIIGHVLYKNIFVPDLEIKTSKNTFFIEKKTKQRSFNKEDLKGPIREISFLEDKETRKQLGKAASEFNKILDTENPEWSKDMNGFLLGRNCASNMNNINSQNKEKNALVLLDMNSAFNSIPEEFVRFLFYRFLGLRKKEANILTECCCMNGFLYQGCPLSPIIFNLYIRGLLNDLNKMGFKVSSYADDITIISNYEYISWKWKKVLKKVCRDYGLKMNQDKTHFAHMGDNKDICGYNLANNEVKSKRKVKKKIKALEHKKNNLKYYVKTENCDKITLRKIERHLDMVIKGYYAWLTSAKYIANNKRKAATFPVQSHN